MRVAILTISDKGFAQEREDASGKAIATIMEEWNYTVSHYKILPDEQPLIQQELLTICDEKIAQLILTTGGTGFAKRDVTPEATLAVVERLCPGIPEAMRSLSLAVTDRAMLTRGVAGIRGETLIINLPGSVKAVKECLGFIQSPLHHGLETLLGTSHECGRS